MNSGSSAAVKPDLYTLHHFAGSGGTILSRVLGGLSNTVVLSEIHLEPVLPQQFNSWWQFANSYGGLIRHEDFAAFKKLEIEQLSLMQTMCARQGFDLIIRDHLHTDFFMKDRQVSDLYEALSALFEVKPIYTWRDPIDVWLSFKSNNWGVNIGQSPIIDVEQFYAKFELSLDYFSSIGAVFLSYEKLVADPSKFVAQCQSILGREEQKTPSLKIDRKPHYTGQSGRVNLDQIAPRGTRWDILSQDEFLFFLRSEHYDQFCAANGLEALKERELPSRLASLL